MGIASGAGGRMLALALTACGALVLLLPWVGARGPSPVVAGGAPAVLEVRGRAVPPLARASATSGSAVLEPSAMLRHVAAEGQRRGTTPAGPRTRAPLATLVGRITRDGQGTPARLLLARGWSSGVVLETTPEGDFRRGGLGPGFHLVTVTVPGRPPCTRQLFLAPHGETILELDVALPRGRTVRVLDAAGEPVAGAVVALDGLDTWTDADGRAPLTWTASGAPELVVRAPGCALHARALDPTDPGAELTVRLQSGCALELRLPTAAAADALVYLLPLETGPIAGHPPRPTTPWHLVSPLRLSPGASVRVDGLPAVELEVRTLPLELAVAPARVRLDASRAREVELRAVARAPGHESLPLDLQGTIQALGELPRLQPLGRWQDAPDRPE